MVDSVAFVHGSGVVDAQVEALLGEGGVLVITWKTADGAAADPDVQVLYVLPPQAVEWDTYRYPPDGRFSPLDVGTWGFQFPNDLVGSWYWRWEAYGAVSAVAEGRIYVAPSLVIGDAVQPIPDEPAAPVIEEGAPSGGDQGGSEPPP
jgi:hypothetical protein